MTSEYKVSYPLAIKLSNKTDYHTLKDSMDSKVKYSNIIAQPEFNLGFHSYIHQTKNKMSITNKLNTKEAFYYIVNPFEVNDDLNKTMKEYLEMDDDNPDILSRAFYKMWEMSIVFDLINNKELSYSALAEGPGSFLQAVLHYRSKFHDLKKDKYHSITIHPEDGNNIDVSKNFLGYYEEKYPKLLRPHKTYKSKTANKYKTKDTGDLTDFKSISNFKKDIKKTKKFSDLVTGDGGFKWNDENYQEQEAYPLIIGQLLAGIMVQEKGGNMVLKMFETFTKVSVKLVYLASTLYNEVYFYKPYFSRISSSERYLICKGFKYDQKKDKNVLDVLFSDLEKILKQFDTEQYINDIFINLDVPEDFLNEMRVFNTIVSNKQQEMINLIVTYINENNYFGDKYHRYLDNHKKSIEFWKENFLVSKEQLSKTHEKFNKYIEEFISSLDDE